MRRKSQARTKLSPANALVVAIVTLLVMCGPVCSQDSELWRSWNQPQEPFRIIGNIYYVGANEITSFLLTSDDGHILLDGGFAETAPIILDNIATLGFEATDIKILINSHAHGDHSGGLAALKKATGATLYIMEGDVPAIESGGKTDPGFPLFPPVEVDITLRPGQAIALGTTVMTANLTAGHSKGCTSWSTRVTDSGIPYDVVFVGSPNVLPDMKLVDNEDYPQIADDFEDTFDMLANLPCDIFLGAHGSFFLLESKIKEMAANPNENPFIDPERYRRFVDRKRKQYEDRLMKQLLLTPGVK